MPGSIAAYPKAEDCADACRARSIGLTDGAKSKEPRGGRGARPSVGAGAGKEADVECGDDNLFSRSQIMQPSRRALRHCCDKGLCYAKIPVGKNTRQMWTSWL